jgi:hypothetical protein
MGDDGPKADARILFLRNRLTSSLKCKDMVLDRLFANEDYGAVVSSFLDTSDTNRLLVFDAGKGELAAVRAGGRPAHIQQTWSTLLFAAPTHTAWRRAALPAGELPALRAARAGAVCAAPCRVAPAGSAPAQCTLSRAMCARAMP